MNLKEFTQYCIISFKRYVIYGKQNILTLMYVRIWRIQKAFVQMLKFIWSTVLGETLQWTIHNANIDEGNLILG